MVTKQTIALLMAAMGLAILAAGAWADTEPPAEPAPASVVINGGFEQWQDAPPALQQALDCRQLPGGWSVSPGVTGKQYSLTRDAEIKRGGTSSVRLANTDTTGGFAISQRLEAEPETRYVVRMWLKAEKIDFYPKGIVVTRVASSQSDKKDTNLWSGSLSVTYEIPSPNSGTFDWKELVGTVDTPVNTKSLMLFVELRGAGAVWLDDVEVTRLEKCLQVESY